MTGLLARAAQRYVAGPETADAMRVALTLARRGLSCTLGYWNSPGDAPAEVAERARDAAHSLDASGVDGYVSVKATALNFDLAPLRTLAPAHVHLDAMDVDTVEPTFAVAAALPGAGVTLPGRWRRSDRDAGTAVALGCPVRVVKGQFPGYSEERDPSAGFLAVIDALAGRAAFVAVASHDAPLAAEALRRLRAARTPCELQLLYGLPIERVLKHTGERTARVYVPYGKAFRPYALRRMRENPKTLLWFVRDLLLQAR